MFGSQPRTSRHGRALHDVAQRCRRSPIREDQSQQQLQGATGASRVGEPVATPSERISVCPGAGSKRPSSPLVQSACLLQCESEHHRGRTRNGSPKRSPPFHHGPKWVSLLRTHPRSIPAGGPTLVRGDGRANRRDDRCLRASGGGTLELDFAFSSACIKRRRHPVVVCAENPVDEYTRELRNTRGICESCEEAV